MSSSPQLPVYRWKEVWKRLEKRVGAGSRRRTNAQTFLNCPSKLFIFLKLNFGETCIFIVLLIFRKMVLVIFLNIAIFLIIKLTEFFIIFRLRIILWGIVRQKNMSPFQILMQEKDGVSFSKHMCTKWNFRISSMDSDLMKNMLSASSINLCKAPESTNPDNSCGQIKITYLINDMAVFDQ